jgi:peptide subunit release factor RF-3
VRVKDGAIKRRDRVQMHATGAMYEVLECGVLRPQMQPREELTTGEVGYLVCNIKTLADVKIGDTVHHQKKTVLALPGFKEPKPMVYAGLYPTSTKDFEALRDALQKLALNDSSLTYVADSSEALGFGFRCGFLGMLHLEIVQERLEREDDLDLARQYLAVVEEQAKASASGELALYAAISRACLQHQAGELSAALQTYDLALATSKSVKELKAGRYLAQFNQAQVQIAYAAGLEDQEQADVLRQQARDTLDLLRVDITLKDVRSRLQEAAEYSYWDLLRSFPALAKADVETALPE